MKYLILLILSGCYRSQPSPPSDIPIPDPVPQVMESDYLKKYLDKEEGVICYRVSSYEGISCVHRHPL